MSPEKSPFHPSKYRLVVGVSSAWLVIENAAISSISYQPSPVTGPKGELTARKYWGLQLAFMLWGRSIVKDTSSEEDSRSPVQPLKTKRSFLSITLAGDSAFTEASSPPSCHPPPFTSPSPGSTVRRYWWVKRACSVMSPSTMIDLEFSPTPSLHFVNRYLSPSLIGISDWTSTFRLPARAPNFMEPSMSGWYCVPLTVTVAFRGASMIMLYPTI